eukprot:CAMPEP_0198213456 /NCGR_PEP_ID=MMETSP1445-20131203/28881_1 /TAXON_ID=36898 /ORGANISM="Pyramimonas sp., Strain CCMP2087" /LENGTH=319 /DNA_ID=CAMNT_0043888107 /DNA_START=94 /DNA_END=1053 /DNA_ORIENTATION=-
MDMRDAPSTYPVPTKPRQLQDSQELLKVVQKQSLASLKSLFGVSDSIARLNHNRYTNFDALAEKHAMLAFDGPAYKGLGAPEFTEADISFAQDHLRILCGLYGVLRPLDAVRPYRLEMSNKLANPRGKDLYTFWGDSITESLNQDLNEAVATKETQKEMFVVNCASQEYFKAVNVEKLAGTIYHMMFPGPSVYAKQARGTMCRFIIKNRVTSPEQLKGFTGTDGEYKFNVSHSTETAFVFVRGVSVKTPKAAVTTPKAAVTTPKVSVGTPKVSVGTSKAAKKPTPAANKPAKEAPKAEQKEPPSNENAREARASKRARK